MRIGLVRLAVALGFVGSLSCDKSNPRPPEVGASPSAIVLPSRPLLAGSTQQLRDSLAQAYRLGPDRRALGALTGLEALLSGEVAPGTSVAFADGKWTVQVGALAAGTLGEFADFPELLSLCASYAEALTKRFPFELAPEPKVATKPARPRKAGRAALPAAAATGALLLQDEAFAALHRIDGRWTAGAHSAAEVHQAALAMTSLAFLAIDSMEVSDALAARALSLVALDRALGSSTPAEEALLAEALGYRRAARTLGEALPETDALGAYFRRDEGALAALARSQSDPAARYLAVRLLVARGEHQRDAVWDAAGDLEGSLPVLAVRLLAHGTVWQDRRMGRVLPLRVMLEAAAQAGDGEALKLKQKLATGGGSDEQRVAQGNTVGAALVKDGVLARFESDLGKLSNGGPVFGPDLQRAYFSALMYSGLDRLARHLLDELSLTTAASSLETALGPVSSKTAVEFERWFDGLISSRSGAAVGADLFAELARLETLGGAPRLRVFDELAATSDYGDPVLPAAVRSLVPRLDARPAHRAALSSLAWTGLKDLALTETLTRASVAVEVDALHEAWFLRFTGEREKLLALLASKAPNPRQKAQMVEWLVADGDLDAAAAEGQLRAFLAPAGDDWRTRTILVALLERQKQYAQARQVITDWQGKKLPERNLNPVLAATALSRQYALEKNPAEAWKAIAEAVESQQLDAMNQGALVLVSLEKLDEACALARKGADRYPGPKSTAMLAEVLWRSGRPDEAAKELANPQRSLRLEDWQKVAEAFFRVYGERQDEALTALAALQKANIDGYSLSELGATADRLGKPALGFEILSRVKTPSQGMLEILVEAYGLKKRLSDQASAFEWLTKRLKPEWSALAQVFAYRRGQPELLWLLPTVQTPTELEFVWVIRAASALKDKGLSAEQQKQLDEHFAEPGEHYYRGVGRFLMGKETEAQVLALADNPKRACEIAYYVGLKAQSQGKLREASDWYRASIETHQTKNAELRWGYDQLHEWLVKGQSLERLAR